jgi:hypothetical protein
MGVVVSLVPKCEGSGAPKTEVCSFPCPKGGTWGTRLPLVPKCEGPGAPKTEVCVPSHVPRAGHWAPCFPWSPSSRDQGHPAGAKAPFFQSKRLAARVNSCPYYKAHPMPYKAHPMPGFHQDVQSSSEEHSLQVARWGQVGQSSGSQLSSSGPSSSPVSVSVTVSTVSQGTTVRERPTFWPAIWRA